MCQRWTSLVICFKSKRVGTSKHKCTFSVLPIISAIEAPVNEGRFPPFLDPLTKSVSYLPKQFVPLSFHSTLDDETSSYFHLQAITKHKMISLLLLQQLLGCPTESLAFASTRSSSLAARSNANNVLERQSIGPLSMAGGEGGEAEWVKGTICITLEMWCMHCFVLSSNARTTPSSLIPFTQQTTSTTALMEAGGGNNPGQFEEDMKMKGLLGPNRGAGNPKLNANSRLIAWLESEGGVYLAESSTWGEAPHPLAISTETVDEITNESSGRGLLARRSINDGDELLKIPMDLCITRKSARKALGKDALQDGINEYLAIACQLIHEKYVLGDESEWDAYMGVLPEVEEVNPTFTWKDEDLAFLDGSPVVAATRSLQMKLRREYDALLGGQDGLIAKFPDRFPAEVCG